MKADSLGTNLQIVLVLSEARSLYRGGVAPVRPGQGSGERELRVPYRFSFSVSLFCLLALKHSLKPFSAHINHPLKSPALVKQSVESF